MRIPATGAFGHIVLPLIPELLSAGHAVTGVDRPEPSAAVEFTATSAARSRN